MKPLSHKEWRKAGSDPPPSREIERERVFLEQQVESGCRIQLATAQALVEALSSTRAWNDRRLLFLRVYGELVNALECLGAWGFAIRSREATPLVLDSFLTYQTTEVEGFYAAVTRHDGDLHELLRLPPTRVVIPRAVAVTGFPAERFVDDYAKCLRNLRESAKAYEGDRHMIAVYNKAKHGAPIMRTGALRRTEFYVVGPQLDRETSGRYLFSKFTASVSEVARLLRLISATTNTTRALVAHLQQLRALGFEVSSVSTPLAPDAPESA